MWRVDKDPHLSSTFGTVSVLDRPPDFDALRARMEQATWAVPRLRWRVQPAPVNLSAPSWVDDPDFDIDNHVRRIALPKPGSMRQLLDLASLHHERHVRPDAAAVAVRRHRGPARRQGGAACRRCTTRSPTARAACRCRCSSSTSTATPRRRRRSTRARPTITPPPPPPSAAETMRDLVAGGFRLPLGVARQVRELLADPTAIPAASAATVDTIRGVLQQLCRRRAGALAAVDRALAAPPLRGRAGAVPGDEGRGQAARRHAQHGVRHRRRRGRVALPRGPRRARRAPAHEHGGEHAHVGRRHERVHAGPHDGPDVGRCRSPSGSA